MKTLPSLLASIVSIEKSGAMTPDDLSRIARIDPIRPVLLSVAGKAHRMAAYDANAFTGALGGWRHTLKLELPVSDPALNGDFRATRLVWNSEPDTAPLFPLVPFLLAAVAGISVLFAVTSILVALR